MLVKELRIGNYILGNYTDYGDFEEGEKQEICEVLSLDSVGVCEYSIWVEGESASVEQYDSFDPIPLTEEWLLKFEFKFGHKLQNFTKGKHQFVEKEYVSGYFCENGEFYFLDRWKVNSVHQIQNLYFTLTGKELTIKQ